MASHIGRRKFLATLGGSAAAWPLAARAQQSRKRIGFLGTSSLSLERDLVDAFVQGLRELGHVDGENVAIEYRWAEGHDNRLPSLAAELVRLGPDVIVTTGTPGTIAAKQATSTVPIVFASSGSPIAAGLVASLARPGGNVTGFTLSGAELEGKRVQLLKEAVPGLSRLAVVWNPANPPVFEFYQLTKAAAVALGLTLQPVVEVGQIDDFKDAFSTIISAKPDAMTVLPDRFLLAHRNEVVSFAANNQLPAVYPYRAYAVAGGLMSYAPNDIDQFRRAAVCVDKVLKGAKPADLPVQEPIKFELVINLRAAKALALTVPDKLLVGADEVIE
jgi:ABC-type uncharacterized transport system substrate-binding protein